MPPSSSSINLTAADRREDFENTTFAAIIRKATDIRRAYSKQAEKYARRLKVAAQRLQELDEAVAAECQKAAGEFASGIEGRFVARESIENQILEGIYQVKLPALTDVVSLADDVLLQTERIAEIELEVRKEELRVVRAGKADEPLRF